MKKVLVTGVTGMVGSHLVDFLIKETKFKIYGACRWRSPTDNIQHLSNHINCKKRVFLKYADLNDVNSIYELINYIKPDFIFHLAAQSFPKSSFQMFDSTYDTNINGTHRLLNAVVKAKIDPLIHVCSSSEIFGKVKADQLPIDENCSFHPASPYAISKIGTDLIARHFYEAYNLKILTTRMFTHTGPRRSDFFAESSFAKQIAMIEKGYQKPTINVGNLNSLRTIADVRDAVRAYHMLLTINPIPGECYNIGGKKSMKIKDILDYLCSISKYPKKIIYKVERDRLRPLDADLQIPNTSKFSSHTGWQPKINYKKTLNDLLNYWRLRIKKNGHFINR